MRSFRQLRLRVTRLARLVITRRRLAVIALCITISCITLQASSSTWSANRRRAIVQQLQQQIQQQQRLAHFVKHSFTQTRARIPHSEPPLEGLDDAKQRPWTSANVSGTASDPKECPDLKNGRGYVPLPSEMKEKFKFQTVDADRGDSFYVFSAYFDQRSNPTPAVIVVGLSVEQTCTKFCRIWYRSDVSDKPHHVTPAQCRYSFENHGRRYSPLLYTCSVRNNDVIPYAVSLVNDPCETSPPQNLLKVLTSSDYDVTSQVNFTVCVTPFNYRYDNVRQLVEMIEVNRIFGAQHFIFYNYSSGPNVTRYLDEFYRKYLDIVTVVPWPLPMPVDVWPPNPQVTPEVHYFGQVAALNDCLYRCIVRRSTFSVFTDLDEIIVPRRRDSWSAMLDDVTTHWQRTKQRSGTESLLPGSYVFRNTFFRTDWTQDQQFAERGDEYQLLDTVLTTEREEKVFEWPSRSKYITWSNAAVMVGVHFSADRYRDVDAVMVDVPDALLHHYRQWKGEDDPVNPPTRIIDRHMHRYADKIARRTAAVHTFMIDGTRESEFKLSTIRNAT